MAGVSKATFNNKDSKFFLTLRERVDHYFKSQDKKQSGNIKLYSKALFLLFLALITYITLVFIRPGNVFSVFLCVLLGLNLAAIGFNVMHDGAHGSFSSKSWVNDLMAFSLNLMGGSAYIWKIKHNHNHHTFTNIEGMDDDIDIKPWIRVSTQQPKHWFHRFQHIYWLFLYAATYFLWVFLLDFNKYFSGKIGETSMKKMKLNDHLVFWFSKFLYIFTFIVIPVYMIGWFKVFIGYLIVLSVTGIVISVVFQLAHVVEEAYFPEVKENENMVKIESEWAVHQIKTTANFATQNKFISWFVGGLNFQVEHHLFPKISHIHYPEISKLVKQTCEDFNLNYIEYPTLASAVKAHVNHLKTIGQAA